MRAYRTLWIAALALAAAGPALAYTIVLKDGSRIEAREKYTIEGERAIITLPSGTETFIDASQIDVRRTEQANQIDYGAARVVEGGRVTSMERDQQWEAPRREPRLSDLISSRAAGVRDRPEARREPDADLPATLPKTRSGWPDLMVLTRKPHRDLELAAELEALLRSQGVDAVRVFQGTRADRALVEFSTNSEASVFRALTVSAGALLAIQERFAGRVGSLELVMITPGRERGGQFLLTPEDAAELAAKRIEVAAFFLDNVQF